MRQATPSDVGAVARTLGRAFRDDPVFTWLDPDVSDDERARRAEPFWRLEARFKVPDGSVWCDDARTGAAIWAAPDRWRTPPLQGVRLALTIARRLGRRTPSALKALQAIEKVHPRQPHWYLHAIGTDPDHRGRGSGAALLEAVLGRCDREGLPAYLESSKESNIPYYERFGWRVTGEIPLAAGGPTLWPMWRDPG